MSFGLVELVILAAGILFIIILGVALEMVYPHLRPCPECGAYIRMEKFLGGTIGECPFCGKMIKEDTK